MDNRPIGIMDSGIGGLTVAEVIHQKYPKEKIIFIGDTARNPYGEKTSAEITSYAEEMKSFLLSKDVKMIIIACNTITFSVPASFYKGKIPVAGMSLPVPENKNIKRLAVFATAATIQSHRHKRRLLEKLPDIDIIEIPVEGLANAIEYRESEEVYRKIIEDSVMKYSAADADTAVLACTHYPLIKDTFEKVLQKVKFIDPAESTVENAMQILEEKNALADTAGRDLFFFTKDEEKSSPLVKKMFGKDSIIEKVVLSGV